MNTKRHLAVLGFLAAILFFTNLGGYDLWPPDEPRFAQVAREMMQSGDYLVPRINGQPYREKPPLLFWAQSAFSLPFGDVTELTARIPSALSGIGVVLLTYLLAARLYGTRTALWAGLILATTQRFWWQARFGQIDMLLALCVTSAFVFFWLWHTERNQAHLIAFYLSVAAGVFAKGPPAILFPLLTIVFFYWRRRADRRQLHWILGLSGILLLIAVWLIPARLAVSAESGAVSGSIASNLYRQTIGRFFLGVSHANPPWYYLLNLPVDLFPWSLFLPWTLPWVWRKRHEGQEMRFLLCWILPALVFFSLCSGKRALYLLPLYPALATLLARSVLALMDGERKRWRMWTGLAWGVVLLLTSAAPFAILMTEYRASWSRSLIVLSVCLAACGVHAVCSAVATDSRRLARDVVIHFSLAATCAAVIAFPLMNTHKSAKAFCEPLRRLSEAGVKYDLYSLGFSREEYVYYAKHFHDTVPSESLRVPGMERIDPMDRTALQAAMLRGIQKAVQDIPIDSVESVGEEDIKRLNDAIMTGVPVPDGMAPVAWAFMAAIKGALGDFLDAMDDEKPAFVMVQERDWLWVMGLQPGARKLPVLVSDSVGSRQVLLVGNAAARELVSGENPAALTVSERSLGTRGA